MNEDRTAGRLVECKKCPCDDFELEEPVEEQGQTKLM